MTADVPILDQRRFGLLRLPPGAEPEEESLASLVRSFADSSAATLYQMSHALGAGDGSGIADLAHRLKGASAMFGAIRLRDACGAIEAAARAGVDPAELQDRVAELAGEVEAARLAMELELDA